METIPFQRVQLKIVQEAGFTFTGVMQGAKREMKKGDVTILFCQPCRHIQFSDGRILKFGHPDFEKIVSKL